jgi:hypothetical protein
LVVFLPSVFAEYRFKFHISCVPGCAVMTAISFPYYCRLFGLPLGLAAQTVQLNDQPRNHPFSQVRLTPHLACKNMDLLLKIK